MTDIERLKNRIARLSILNEVASPQGRKLEISASITALATMLREIEETERPRKLEFRNHRNEVVSLNVRSGQIREIVMPTSLKHSDRVEELLNKPFSERSASLGRSVKELLSRFASGAKDLMVVSVPLKIDSIGNDRGLCPSDFLEAQVSPSTLTPLEIASAVNRFKKNLEGWALASIETEERGLMTKQGSAAETDHLLQLAELKRAAMSSAGGPTENAPSCLMLSSETENSSAIFFGYAQGTLIVALFDADRIADVLSCWYQTFDGRDELWGRMAIRAQSGRSP